MLGNVTVPGQMALLSEGLSGPTWLGAQLGLIVDNNPQTINDTMASHTEASFTGYSRKALPWGPVGWDAAGVQADVAGSAVQAWQGPSDGSGQQITGWIIVQGSESGSGSGSPGAPLLLAVGGLDGNTAGLMTPADVLPVTADLDLEAQATVTTIT